jgi:hypothetical protein
MARSAMKRPHRLHQRLRGLLAVIALTVPLMAACGGGENSSSAGGQEKNRPLTIDEAAALAQVLFLNYELGGADFRATSISAPGGAQVQLQGVIDWKNHTGRTAVQVQIPDTQINEVYWQQMLVAERRPSLDAILMGLGTASPPVLVRAPNMNLRLDQILGVITGLATQQPENAQLILQNPGSQFVRNDSLHGEDVMVLRYGKRSLYWIVLESGRLARFEGNSAKGDLPLIVDFPSTGPRSVNFPTEDQFVRPDQLGELSNVLSTW